MNQINFGKKIPIATCQIQRKNNKKFEHATIYEYTCKDKSDLRELEKLADEKKWEYGWVIWGNAYNKAHPSTTEHKKVNIYTIENAKGQTIAICDTYEDKKEIRVKHIESKEKNPYKYAGQNMLAMLAKKVLSTNREDLYINDGQPEAHDFYKSKCGFDIVGFNPTDPNGIDYEMRQEDIPYFLMCTEEKTGMPIIDLQG